TEVPRYLLIDYRGEVRSNQATPPFSTVPVMDLLEGKAGTQLRGKAVLIGFGSTEIGDRISTPVSEKLPMPGVEIHANLVDSVLGGRTLRPLKEWANAIFLLVCSFISTWFV